MARGYRKREISVIPNFVDTDFIHPLPKTNSFGQKHGLTDKFVVSHIGNLGHVYDMYTFLEAAALLRAENDILFLIMGNGVIKSALEDKARELKLRNVRFMPFHPYESMPVVRASSDVQVSLYREGAASNSFPSKIYEIMASGRPLLAAAEHDSEVGRVVRNAGCGVCIAPGQPEQLAESILTLYNDASLREKMGEDGRRYAEENYSRQAAVGRYDELLRAVARR